MSPQNIERPPLGPNQLRCSADASDAATQAMIETLAITTQPLIIFINQTPHRIMGFILRQPRCNRQDRVIKMSQTLLILTGRTNLFGTNADERQARRRDLQNCYADRALIAKIELHSRCPLSLAQDFDRAMEEAVMAVLRTDVQLHGISEFLRAPPIDDDRTFA